MTARAIAAAAIAAVVGGALVAWTRASADEPEVVLRTGEVSLAVGEAGALSVTVLPGNGRTVSADGPVRLIVDAAGEGLTLPRKRYGRRDAADPAALAPRFDVRVRARAPGDHPVTVEARLWLCGPKLCKPVRITRTVTVHVAAPPPPLDAGLDAPAVLDAGVDAGRRRR